MHIDFSFEEAENFFFKFTEFTAEAKYGIESGKKDKNHPQYNLLRTLRQNCQIFISQLLF